LQLGPGEGLAEVRFGYEEFGTAAQYYCTSRKDSCASRADSTLFNYIGADGHSASTCANGCKVSIPALPGRILWWQEYRSSDGGSTWSAKSQPNVLAVP
jgi:hypothetical protein